MFTGIVEEAGEVLDTWQHSDGRRVRVGASFAGALSPGQSVSVNGACLTVEARDEQGFEVFLATETVSRTYLGDLEPGDLVNLERALSMEDRLDGHIVQGHVDATASVRAVERVGEAPDGGDWEFVFSLPPAVAPYVVEKGSIAVDGISLTVADRRADRFAVAIVPTTHERTVLSEKDVGDPVHLEADVLAKYVERLVEPHRQGSDP